MGEDHYFLFLLGCLLVVLAVFLFGGCSTTNGRFDTRPDICRDLGKRGAEC